VPREPAAAPGVALTLTLTVTLAAALTLTLTLTLTLSLTLTPLLLQASLAEPPRDWKKHSLPCLARQVRFRVRVRVR